MSDTRKLTLWHTIDWYASSIGTEHEKRERAVLDRAIDAALADSATAEPHEFVGRSDRWCEICDKPDRDSVHIVIADNATCPTCKEVREPGVLGHLPSAAPRPLV